MTRVYRSFLKFEVDSKERSTATGGSGTSNKTVTSNDTIWSPCTPSAMALYSNAPLNDCVFCGLEAHDTEGCKEYLILNEKKKHLSSEGRRFRCIIKGYRARDCRRKVVCNTCQGMHATTACTSDFYQEKGSAKNTEVKSLNMHASSTKSYYRHLDLRLSHPRIPATSEESWPT